jgi:glycosyltransferase involved in cell wall biosynthesis
MLYCFLGSALRSFQHARQLGVLTVLDVPISLNANQIVAEEKQHLGIPSRHSKLASRLQAEVLAADYLLVPSASVAESVVALGVLPTRVITVPFGVDVKHFRPRLPSHRSANDRFRVLFVGKFDLRKGIHHLLEAWHDLALPNSELVIVGPPGDLNFVRKMRAQYSGIFTEVGNVPHRLLPELYAQADVCVFPSLAEGSALVTYEALASGLPCIVTYEAGSVVRDGIDGFVVPRGDIPSLKERLLRLYHDGALRRQMSVAARQRAEEYSWQHYHMRLVDALVCMVAEWHVD